MPEGIQKLFSEVPDRYELINHIITLGLDRRWRCKAAEALSNVILRAGFSEVTFTKMLCGVAAIHEAVK